MGGGTDLDSKKLIDQRQEHSLFTVPNLPGIDLYSASELPALPTVLHKDLNIYRPCQCLSIIPVEVYAYVCIFCVQQPSPLLFSDNFVCIYLFSKQQFLFSTNWVPLKKLYREKRLTSYWSPAHNLANPARPTKQMGTMRLLIRGPLGHGQGQSYLDLPAGIGSKHLHVHA